MGRECVGGGVVGVVLRSLRFKISLSQFLLLVRLYILYMCETCDLARYNVAFGG